MIEHDDFDGLLDRFFAEGPLEIADDVIEASLLTIDTTAQRRAGFDPRRNLPMTTLARFGLAAAAVLAVALLGTLVLPAVQGTAGRSPSATLGAAIPPSNLPPSAIPSSANGPTASSGPNLLAPLGYPGTGTIVFARMHTGLDDQATFAIDLHGSRETPLRVPAGWGGATSLPGTGCCAVLSPDGKQVAVGYDEANPGRGSGALAAAQILNIGGSAPGSPIRTIPTDCGGCGSINGINYVPSAWSADASLIAAEVWNDTDPTRDGINLAPIHGHDWAMQVTGAHPDVPVAFSPDGSRLLFVRRSSSGSTGTLMVASIKTTKGVITAGQPRAISAAAEGVYVDGYFGPAASWSPDGTRIAYAATDATGSANAMTVYVVDASGGTPKAIAGPAAFITFARWSPDGTWIAFDLPTGGAGTHDEYVIHPDGSSSTNLTARFNPGVCCGRWAPDSSALVVAGTAGADDLSDLVIVPVNGDPIFQVTQSPAFYTDFSWSPAKR